MVLHPTYFPNIAHYVAILSAKDLVFEVCDNYQKQTYRNRCDIYGANGKLTLTIPVSYTQKNRQRCKDVTISTSENWQVQHLKSLDSAYRMSPFYEFYIDAIRPLFQTEFKYLLDINLKCFEILSECLEINTPFIISKTYAPSENEANDFRHLVNAKKNTPIHFEKYTQVFTEKHGFLSNLSMLDLLFNEGPNAANYLQKQVNFL